MIVTNQSNVKYDYVLPDQSTQSGEQSSNIVNTEILTSAVTKVKSSDHTFLSEGETAQQTVVVTNNSTVTLQNVFFKDVMSGGASYVAAASSSTASRSRLTTSSRDSRSPISPPAAASPSRIPSAPTAR